MMSRRVVASFLKKVHAAQQPKQAAFSTYKTSTGLVGLAVDENGRQNLINISTQILESVKKIPESSGYRVNVEKWFKFITKTASSSQDVKAIEDEIGLGQIEEVIEIAKDELSLVDYYYEQRGWELVEDEKKRAEKVVAAMADSINFTTQASTMPPPPPPPAAAPPAAAAKK